MNLYKSPRGALCRHHVKSQWQHSTSNYGTGETCLLTLQPLHPPRNQHPKDVFPEGLGSTASQTKQDAQRYIPEGHCIERSPGSHRLISACKPQVYKGGTPSHFPAAPSQYVLPGDWDLCHRTSSYSHGHSHSHSKLPLAEGLLIFPDREAGKHSSMAGYSQCSHSSANSMGNSQSHYIPLWVQILV